MPKKPKKPEKLRSLIKKVQTEFNSFITSSIGYCQKDSKRYERLECSHVLSIGAYPNLRFDVMNVLCFCARHHRWWWHDEPTESGKWFKEKFPERWEYLLKAKNIQKHWNIDDVKEIREAIKNNDIEKLLVPKHLIR